MAAARRTRPGPDQRQRDAERTQQALVDAAEVEFAAKGLAGARVSEIAERAGVNKQLISYYFGGKEGLYQALLERWYALEAEMAEPDISLDELVCRYLATGLEQPDLQRLFVRESIEAEPDDVAYEPDAPEVVDLRRRQDGGEIAPELDPAFVLLMFQSAVVANVVFPGDVKRLLGLDPASPEYFAHADEQLRLLVRRLACSLDDD